MGLAKRYIAGDVELRLQALWQEEGTYHFDPDLEGAETGTGQSYYCPECGIKIENYSTYKPYSADIAHKAGCSWRYNLCATRKEAWELVQIDLMRSPRLETRLKMMDRYGALELLHDLWEEVGIE